VPFTAEKIPTPSIPHHSEYPTRPMKYLVPGGEVPVIDEDVPVLPGNLKRMINLNNRVAPHTDRYIPLSSREEGAQYLGANFGRYAPKSRVNWNGQNATGNTALAWWATAGFGAIELKRLDARTADAEHAGDQAPCPVSSYEFLKDIPVRPGLAPFGGAVYLDNRGEFLKIKLRGKDVLSSEGAAWEEAKFVYRSSCMLWCNLFHHLFYTHYIVSNHGLPATLRNLPTDNPLRPLVKPFIFRTAAVNIGGFAFTQELNSATRLRLRRF
jgi:hypothetical protein